MSLKSGIYKHRRTVRRVVAGVVVLCCLWAVYIRYVSPTRVALVNFPAYQASSIALANESRWVRVDVCLLYTSGSFIDCFSMPGCYAIPVRRFSEVLGKNAIVLSTGNYFPCLILSSFLFFLLVSWPEFRTRDRSVRCLYFGYSCLLYTSISSCV